MSSVVLGWNTDADAINGFNVYRGSFSGGETTLLNSSPIAGTTFTDSSPMVGANYYVIKAVGYGGTLSTVSNEVAFISSPVVASLAGSGSVTATLDLNAAAALSGAGSVIGVVTGQLSSSSFVQGVGSVVAKISNPVSGSLTGVGSVLAAPVQSAFVVSSLLGVGSVSAALVNTSITASLVGVGSVSGILTGALSAPVSGSGSVSATPKTTNPIVASISGAGSLTGLVVGEHLVSSISGSGSVSANGRVDLPVSATLSGLGSVVAATTGSVAVSASLSGLGSVSAVASLPVLVSMIGSGSVLGNIVSFTPVYNPTAPYVLSDFGASPQNQAYVATNKNSLMLFAQPTFGSNRNTTVFQPPWNPQGTPNSFGYQGRIQFPGLLLVAPGTGSLNGKVYKILVIGTVVIPSSASGAGFSLILNENYFAYGVAPISDSLFTFVSPTGLAPGNYSFSMTATLSGAGTGALSCAGVLTLNGAQYFGSGYSNRLQNQEPIIQLSLGVSFAGSVSGQDVFEASIAKFQMLQS